MDWTAWYWWVGLAIVLVVLLLLLRKGGFRLGAEAFGAKVEVEGKGEGIRGGEGEPKAAHATPASMQAAARGKGNIAVGRRRNRHVVAERRDRTTEMASARGHPADPTPVSALRPTATATSPLAATPWCLRRRYGRPSRPRWRPRAGRAFSCSSALSVRLLRPLARSDAGAGRRRSIARRRTLRARLRRWAGRPGPRSSSACLPLSERRSARLPARRQPWVQRRPQRARRLRRRQCAASRAGAARRRRTKGRRGRRRQSRGRHGRTPTRGSALRPRHGRCPCRLSRRPPTSTPPIAGPGSSSPGWRQQVGIWTELKSRQSAHVKPRVHRATLATRWWH